MSNEVIAVKQFVKSRPAWQIVVALAVGAVLLWYALGGFRNWYDSRQWQKLAAEAKADADRARAEALAAQKLVDEAKERVKESEKAVAVAEAQRDAAVADRDRVAGELEGAHQTTERVRTVYRERRANPVRRAGTIDERVKRLGADLDRLDSSTRQNP